MARGTQLLILSSIFTLAYLNSAQHDREGGRVPTALGAETSARTNGTSVNFGQHQIFFKSSGETNHSENEGFSLKIHCGKEAKEGRFSFVTYLKTNTKMHMLCSGFFVDSQYVATAAHCVDGHPDSLGSYPDVYFRPRQKIQQIGVDKVILHPNYTRDNVHGWDIALVKLERPIYDIQIPWIPKDHYQFTQSQLCALGWGALNSYEPSSRLRISCTLELVEQERCSELANVTADMLCLNAPERGSPCKGDSGGPVLIPKGDPYGSSDVANAEPDIIVGMTFFGQSCDIPNSMGSYVPMSTVREWILSQIKDPIRTCINEIISGEDTQAGPQVTIVAAQRIDDVYQELAFAVIIVPVIAGAIGAAVGLGMGEAIKAAIQGLLHRSQNGEVAAGPGESVAQVSNMSQDLAENSTARSVSDTTPDNGIGAEFQRQEETNISSVGSGSSSSQPQDTTDDKGTNSRKKLLMRIFQWIKDKFGSSSGQKIRTLHQLLMKLKSVRRRFWGKAKCM